MAAGTVYLVGAGPGDPGLLTLRGAELLARADVVIYDGLANAALLSLAPATAEKIYAGKKRSEHGAPLTQQGIEDVLVDRARLGKTVVRLKGGDPFVFGRGGEEAEALVAAGIRFEVVPGVSAVSAVPAYAGIPLTHRDAAASVAVIATGQEEGDRQRIDWSAAARADTVVLFMAVKTLPEIAASLVAAGRSADTPAAVIRWGTTASQVTLVATLGTIAEAVAAAKLEPPALVIVGDVVRYRDRLAWFEKRPLFGKSVLIPRAPAQAGPLAAAVADLGGEPVVHEVTRILPGEPVALEPRPRWIAFASVHAVTATLEGKDVRVLAGVRIAAVGEATAAALRAHGLVADLVPDEKNAAGLARALLAADPDLAGSRVLLPRAAEGREELAEALAAAGAQVVSVAAYRTVLLGRDELAPLVQRLPRLHVATFFAPSQVEALIAAAGVEALRRIPTLCAIGATTAAALAAHGLRVDVVPSSPERLLAEIVSHLHPEDS